MKTIAEDYPLHMWLWHNATGWHMRETNEGVPFAEEVMVWPHKPNMDREYYIAKLQQEIFYAKKDKDSAEQELEKTRTERDYWKNLAEIYRITVDSALDKK